jgi:hypothetical protein
MKCPSQRIHRLLASYCMAFPFCRLIDIDGKHNSSEGKDWIMGSWLRRLDENMLLPFRLSYLYTLAYSQKMHF